MSEPTLYDEKLVKARKPHKCSGCGVAIAKGESCYHIRELLGDTWGSYKHCSDCNTVMDHIGVAGLSEHYTLEDPRQYLIDTRDYDETAADIADKLRLPVAYVAEVVK